MIDYIGTTFNSNSQWFTDELEVIGLVRKQINWHWPQGRNLFINLTWFGPQFDNGQWDRFQNIVGNRHVYDRLFVLAAADPSFLSLDQISEMAQAVGAKELYHIGHFDTDWNFNFHSLVIPKYFVRYQPEELVMQDPKWVFLNYNRKPRGHRAALVELLTQQGLDQHGVITLGENVNQAWGNHSAQSRTLGETPETAVGNWGMDMSMGIPHDIHSLGNLDLWRSHFLTVVGETEFYPWDPTFVSEKTWKPIIGGRPFLINGQSKAYQWLRDRGFRTFTHLFPGNLDQATELDIHAGIADAIKWLTAQNLTELYQQLQPDLQYNQQRYWEFCDEQYRRVRKLF